MIDHIPQATLGRICECFMDSAFHQLGRHSQLHRYKFGHHIGGLGFSRLAALLSLNRLERGGHFPNLGGGYMREYIVVKMDCTALPSDFMDLNP